ncbi:hypothetical protein [Thalassobaculum sp.]|uniref:hypothetical protein n=1 Tax=Thalassobaculum sp. TaxID=2022740 RepID=UPI0032ED4E27
MLWIERVMAAIAEFIACDLFRLDSRDIERVREQEYGGTEVCPAGRRNTQVVVRFGR